MMVDNLCRYCDHPSGSHGQRGCIAGTCRCLRNRESAELSSAEMRRDSCVPTDAERITQGERCHCRGKHGWCHCQHRVDEDTREARHATYIKAKEERAR